MEGVSMEYLHPTAPEKFGYTISAIDQIRKSASGRLPTSKLSMQSPTPLPHRNTLIHPRISPAHTYFLTTNTMASSPASSDLSDPPSVDSDAEGETLSTAVPSSRPSVDIPERDHLPLPPSKRRKTNGPSTLERPTSAQPPDEAVDTLSLSSDSFSSAPGSPTHDEYTLREEAQTQCLWRDCDFGNATNNDELVRHVQGTHCATGGPKRTKYVCEWGECQRKASNHPSGYALKAHMRSHTKEKPYYCALPGTLYDK